WVYVRGGRPWPGPDPPAAVYFYSPDRRAERPAAHLTKFRGVLQVDGYPGFETLTAGEILLAACRVGGDVAGPAPHRPGRADYPHPVLRASGSLRRHCTGGRLKLAVRGVARAWPGSVATADCCGGHAGGAIFSRSASVGDGTT